jgi:quercetin dioxygenase-like cupin family protein
MKQPDLDVIVVGAGIGGAAAACHEKLYPLSAIQYPVSYSRRKKMIQVRDFRDVAAQPAAEGVTMRVVIGPEEGAPFFNMRLFEVQPGCASPHHSHWWEHEVFILSGQGMVKTEQGDIPIGHGSTVFVPGGEMHQFRNGGDDVLRFLCLVPQDWLREVKKQA